jgi:hypothetical protein
MALQVGDREKAGEMRIRLSISVTDRSQITNLPVDTQILKGRTTWRNLPSIFLILHDFDYLPRFFSVSFFPVSTSARIAQKVKRAANCTWRGLNIARGVP